MRFEQSEEIELSQDEELVLRPNKRRRLSEDEAEPE